MNSLPRPVVLDTSVVLAWLLDDEEFHRQARAVADDIAEGGLEPVAAPNLRFELRHGLVRAARRGRLAWTTIGRRLVAVEAMAIGVPAVALEDEPLLKLCHRRSLGWGDAHHALLARRLGRPLVTADRRLVDHLSGSDVWVEWLGDRPTE